MVTIKLKTTVKQRLHASCPTHSRSDISVRDVSMIIDEPVERDGTNLGPTPTETALAALAGCTNVIGNKVAHKLGIDVSNFKVSIVADFDRRGVTLSEEIDVPFEAIKLQVELDTNASQSEIDQLATEVAKYCPLAKLFRPSRNQARRRMDHPRWLSAQVTMQRNETINNHQLNIREKQPWLTIEQSWKNRMRTGNSNGISRFGCPGICCTDNQTHRD